MELIIQPQRADWKKILQRPYVDNRAVLESVQMILNAVKQHGDEAVRSFTKKFDGIDCDPEIAEDDIARAADKIPAELREAIEQAAHNIRTFHRQQFEEPQMVETMPGIQCWRRSVAIDKIGLYIPGGTAPLFSTVLMLGIPAQLAGCPDISLFTPAGPDGQVHPAILYSASMAGIRKMYRIGGAQAIAAMAYGTESVTAVDKIFGPGNQYVTAAKQLVQLQGVAIDMPAGPSEVCVLADDEARPAFVAADLLSQAEHGADSQVLLVSTSRQLIDEVLAELDIQLNDLPRKEMASKALENSKAILVSSLEEAMELVNAYAAEHLILCCRDAASWAGKVRNAGSVFLGHYSPESVGDYASGTNHTLPTNGFARAYSGVSLDSFMKKITFQQLTEEGLKAIAPAVTTMARAEGLHAHALAVDKRMESIVSRKTSKHGI